MSLSAATTTTRLAEEVATSAAMSSHTPAVSAMPLPTTATTEHSSNTFRISSA